MRPSDGEKIDRKSICIDTIPEDVLCVMLDVCLESSVSRTTHCLCLTVITSSNISTSRPTSTPSAFEVSAYI